MAEKSKEVGMVGPFWMVEEEGNAAIIALAVRLDRADAYGDMLTVDTGHLEHWSRLARRGVVALREAGIPTAPVWSEYEEWPRGRVLYDRVARRVVVRADTHLHQPEFLRLIAERFRINLATAIVLPDEHYQSVRRVSLPRAA
jgi:hypothetical protein